MPNEQAAITLKFLPRGGAKVHGFGMGLANNVGIQWQVAGLGMGDYMQVHVSALLEPR